MEKIKFLNTFINNLTMSETVLAVDNLIKSQKKSYVTPINVDVVVKIEKDNFLKQIIDEADLTIIDGKPLVWIGKIKGINIKEKVSGSDLVIELLKLADKKKYSIFILGGQEGVAKNAKTNIINKYKNISYIDTYSPPLGFEKDVKELEHINDIINKSKYDIMITCFGCPKQEKWIYNNYKLLNVKVSICAGATVDFLAGNIKRAPKWMSNCGIEWLYRFLQEPKRLFKRYFIDDIKILNLIRKYK